LPQVTQHAQSIDRISIQAPLISMFMPFSLPKLHVEVAVLGSMVTWSILFGMWTTVHREHDQSYYRLMHSMVS
jgi:hypothetical protein